MKAVYKRWGRIVFITDLLCNDWDGGGMLCSSPVGYQIILWVFRVRLSIEYRYTKRQLLKLAKKHPDLWDNCRPPKE